MNAKVYLDKRKNEVCKINDGPARKKKIRHFPDFPSQIMDDEAKNKILGIISTMYRSLYIIPFLHMEKLQDVDQAILSFAQIQDKLKKNRYLSTTNVLKDLYSASSRQMNNEEIQFNLKGDGDYSDMNILCSRSDLEHASGKLTKILTNKVSQEFPPKNPLMPLKPSSSPQFPQGPSVTESNTSCTTESSNKEKVFTIEGNDKIKIYPLNLYSGHIYNNNRGMHYYIAGHQFHRMLSQWANAPVHVRNIIDPANAIETISYIENTEQYQAYYATKERYLREAKVNRDGEVVEQLLFHGTSLSSLESILKHNFIIDNIPQGDHNRKKQMLFGRGVYFSKLPAISLMYGNVVLLCKILPGKCEAYAPDGTSPIEIPEEFDSREVRSRDNFGVINVIKHPHQILPYCILYLKKDALTQTHQALDMQQFMRISISPPASIKRKALISSQATTLAYRFNQSGYTIPTAITFPKDITRIVPVEIKCTNEDDVRTYISLHSRSTRVIDANLNSNTACPICQEGLQSAGVSSLRICKHYFHSSCLESMISKQASPTHLVCPLCSTVHGIRTGDMPMASEMSWWKEPRLDLPGNIGLGSFVIMYHVKDGIQGKGHPHPDKPFKALGFPRYAFLPGNDEGERVIKLLCLAFQRRLTFSVGQSLSKGPNVGDCVIWGEIHHKTSIEPGNIHGYPDIGYLKRVTTELSNLGVYI